VTPRTSSGPAQNRPTHVALLRGINVGGKHIIPMKSLASLFESSGCSRVATYIQSGNVVFTADAALVTRLATDLPKLIGRTFGFEPVVVIRTRTAFAKVVRNNPFLATGIDTATLHVGFLAAKPSAKRIAKLDPDRSPGDAFAVRGREIYFHLPNGMGRTKLTSAYLDSALGTTCTARNWRTTLKIAELLGVGTA